MYEMFVGPPELDAEWDDRGIDGVNRFLRRFWNLAEESLEKDIKATGDMIRTRHQLVHDVTTRLEGFSLNTVISAFMEYNNKLLDLAKEAGGVDRETVLTFARLLAPFAPHIAEEVWEMGGNSGSVFASGWPEYDTEAMKEDTIEIPVQVNGKIRAVVKAPADVSKDEALRLGKEAIADRLSGDIVKEIYVPGKIINIVVKGG